MRWFISFLLGTTIVCFYGTFLSGHVFWYDVILQNRLLEYKLGNQPLPWSIFLQYVLFLGGPGLLGLGLFATFAGLAVLAFLIYHLYLISRNTTTLESVKWSAATKIYKKQAPMREKLLQQVSEGENPNIVFTNESDGSEEILIGEPLNVYNRGILRNFWEILMPIAERDPPMTRPIESMMKRVKARQEYQKGFPRYDKLNELPKVSDRIKIDFNKRKLY